MPCSSGDGRDFLRRGRLAGEMDREHRANPRCARPIERVRQVVRPHQPGIRVDVGEHHLGAGQANRVGGGEEGDRGNHRRIPPPELKAHGGEVKRRRAVGARHRVGRTHRRGECALEGGDGRAGGEEAAAQHLHHRGDVVFLHAVPAVGQECRHGAVRPLLRAAFTTGRSRP